MKALQLLQQMDFECKRDLLKHVPEIAIPRTKFSDRTANDLTKAILAFLKLKGHMAWRQASEGRYRPGKQYTDVIGRTRIMKGQYFPGTNEGHSDVCSIINGTFTAIEVKMKDKQSPQQKRYQQQVEDNGGKYFIARNFESFYQYYKTTTSCA